MHGCLNFLASFVVTVTCANTFLDNQLLGHHPWALTVSLTFAFFYFTFSILFVGLLFRSFQNSQELPLSCNFSEDQDTKKFDIIGTPTRGVRLCVLVTKNRFYRKQRHKEFFFSLSQQEHLPFSNI